jgi:hypothetical protein
MVWRRERMPIIAKFIQSFILFYFFFLLFFLSGLIIQNGIIYGNNEYKENDIVSVQINTKEKTVHVLINKILQPVSLCNVPFPVKSEVYFFVGYLLIFIDLY